MLLMIKGSAFKLISHIAQHNKIDEFPGIVQKNLRRFANPYHNLHVTLFSTYHNSNKSDQVARMLEIASLLHKELAIPIQKFGLILKHTVIENDNGIDHKPSSWVLIDSKGTLYNIENSIFKEQDSCIIKFNNQQIKFFESMMPQEIPTRIENIYHFENKIVKYPVNMAKLISRGEKNYDFYKHTIKKKLSDDINKELSKLDVCKKQYMKILLDKEYQNLINEIKLKQTNLKNYMFKL